MARRLLKRSTMNASAVDFESVMKHFPIGMALVAPTGAWLAVNPALCELVGYTREELLAGDLSITHPEDLARDLEHAERALAGMIERYHLEKRFLCKDGRILWVELHVSLVRHGDGAPKHFITQIVDITERRYIAQAQVESRTKLLLALRGGRIATWEYDVLRDRFTFDEQAPQIFHSMRDARRYTLADYIHEFVVPRDDAIFANAMREALASRADSFTAHFEHEVIRHDGARGIHAVWFSAIRSGDRVIKLVGATQDVTEHRRVEKQVRQAQKMEAVGQLVSSVAHDFSNILSAILMQVEEVSNRPGLDPDVLGAIRDIGDVARRAVRLTHLLLLLNHKQLVQSRQVDPFEVLLPASSEPGKPRAGTLPPEPACGGNETILLVEDDPSLRRLTRALLERHGYRVLEARSGVEALEVWDAASQRIDLVLTELTMPDGICGRELANRLQARAPDLKIILTSGYGADIALYAREMHDGRRFLAKPSTPYGLLEAVRWCLDRR